MVLFNKTAQEKKKKQWGTNGYLISASLHLNYFMWTSASHLGVVLFHREHLAMFKDILIYHNLGERLLLASNG